MAKTKKEETIDLKPEKVTEEQLKHQALHFLAGVNDELVLLQNELKDQYGTDDINIEDGVIKYPENGEADKKD